GFEHRLTIFRGIEKIRHGEADAWWEIGGNQRSLASQLAWRMFRQRAMRPSYQSWKRADRTGGRAAWQTRPANRGPTTAENLRLGPACPAYRPPGTPIAAVLHRPPGNAADCRTLRQSCCLAGRQAFTGAGVRGCLIPASREPARG